MRRRLKAFVRPLMGGPSRHGNSEVTQASTQTSSISDPSSLAVYQYVPLTSESDIRLVELLPCQKSDSNSHTIISCQLHEISFDDCPAYEALSYHWGDPTSTLSITVDGKSFHVTKNLAEALQCLTPTENSRLLWIDAICINQTDDLERSHQVQRMAKIYEDAERVLVWLGLGDPDMLAAFQRLTKEEEYKIHSLQELEKRRNMRITDATQATPKDFFDEMRDPDSDNDDELYAELPILRRPTLGLGEPTSSEISAIDKIFQHPWWERVWVIQEATVARELCIICGRQELPWNRLCQIYPATITKPGHVALSPHEKNLEPLRRLNGIRNQWKYFQETETTRRPHLEPENEAAFLHPGVEGVLFSLDYLISTFRSSQATDPRDKIYALLGLASDRDEIDLDYTISTVQVYLRWAMVMLIGSKHSPIMPDGGWGDLRFLDYCLPFPNPTLQGLPSWVPDWTFSSAYIPARQMQVSFGPLPRASGDYTGWKGSIQSAHEPYTLNIWGVLSDRITETGNPMSMSEALLGPLFQAFAAVRAISTPAKDVVKYDFKRAFSEYQFLELSDKLEGLEASFKAAALAEGLDDPLLHSLEKLFVVDSRPTISNGITQHEIDTDTVDDVGMRRLLAYMYKCNSARRFFVTERGRFGIGRVDIREGDLVCVLLGAVDPSVIQEEGNHHVFVGNCFCQGLMSGEVAEGLKEGKVKMEEFILY